MHRWLTLLLLLGCGDDGERAAPEGGTPLDAAARDVSIDAQSAVASAPPSCRRDVRTFALGASDARSFSALFDGERLHLALVAASCGDASDGQGRGLRYLNFVPGADAGAARDVDSEDCLPLREPTLLLHGKLALYFGSDRGEHFDLYETEPLQPMRRWAQRSHDAAFEVALSAAALGPERAPHLAYVAQASVDARDPAPIRLDDRDVLPSVAGQHPVSLALARREDGLQQGRGVLGWAGDQGVFLRLLTDTGGLVGEPVKIGTGGAIAFAARPEVTGVFYGALSYRALGSSLGSATTFEAVPELHALAATAYGPGFAVAYRDGSSLYALTLSLDGRITARATLKTDAPGNDLQLLSSGGALIAVWDERGGDAGAERTLHVAKLACL